MELIYYLFMTTFLLVDSRIRIFDFESLDFKMMNHFT